MCKTDPDRRPTRAPLRPEGGWGVLPPLFSLWQAAPLLLLVPLMAGMQLWLWKGHTVFKKHGSSELTTTIWSLQEFTTTTQKPPRVDNSHPEALRN